MLPEKETPVRFDPNRRLSLPERRHFSAAAYYIPGQGGVADLPTGAMPFITNF